MSFSSSLDAALAIFIQSTEEAKKEEARGQYLIQLSPSNFSRQVTSGTSSFSSQEASFISREAIKLASRLIKAHPKRFQILEGNPSAIVASNRNNAAMFMRHLNDIMSKNEDKFSSSASFSRGTTFQAGRQQGASTAQSAKGLSALENVKPETARERRILSSIKRAAKASHKELLRVDATGSFKRSVGPSGIQASLTYVFPEHRAQKQSKQGKSVRASAAKRTVRKLSQLLRTKELNIVKIGGKASILQGITDTLLSILRKGTASTKLSSSRVKSSKKKNISTTRKTVTNTILSGGTSPEESITSLKTLINEVLALTIEANMGRPELIYRTGRFADSAEVTHISINRDQSLNILYSYMKYPYQTFEPGFAQGKTSWDPRNLIDKSIREIARGLTTRKFKTTSV